MENTCFLIAGMRTCENQGSSNGSHIMRTELHQLKVIFGWSSMNFQGLLNPTKYYLNNWFMQFIDQEK